MNPVPAICINKRQIPVNLAPITLFVYNRPWHTRQTVEALQKNELAEDSDLYIYADAPKRLEHDDAVNEVREYIHGISGFRSVIIVEREKNYGLAESIITGVTEIVNRFGTVIVLEDDLVTSPFFLRFMNESLDRYADNPLVWHVNGWNYPIDPTGLPDTFFWRVMACWGWATWSTRWMHFEKNPNKLTSSWDGELIKRFNLDGADDLWAQVEGNLNGSIDTWAIFWYATIFKNGGLCLSPKSPLLQNIGVDGSGENRCNSKIYETGMMQRCPSEYPKDLIENHLVVDRIKSFHILNRPSLIHRIIRTVRKYLLRVPNIFSNSIVTAL